MNIAKLILTITVVVLLAFAPAVANGQTFDFTFSGDISNTWNDSGNWEEANGPPVAGDTVLIPTGKECHVTAANQSASSITIESGATLKIIGKNLSMQGKILNLVVVHGELIFEQPGEVAAQLLYDGPFTRPFMLLGSGTVKARAVDGDGPGTIDAMPSATGDIDIRAGLTLVGSLTIRSSSEIHLGGTIKVDHADDMLVIGKLESSGDTPVLVGGGVVEASAGRLKIGRMKVGINSTATEMKATGGTIELTSHLDQTTWNNVTVTVNNGGTFDVKRDGWESRGGFSLTNGAIDVFVLQQRDVQVNVPVDRRCATGVPRTTARQARGC